VSAVSLVRRIALPGFALLLLCGCASHERPVSAPKMSQPRVPRELRVMTFNLRVRTILDGLNIWDLRRELVVQRVRAFDPHLLGTQEGLASMEAFLREQLSDYTFFGVGRSDGKCRGEMCGVFFKTARFELLDGGRCWRSRHRRGLCRTTFSASPIQSLRARKGPSTSLPGGPAARA